MCFEVGPVGLGLLNCFSKETEVLLLFVAGGIDPLYGKQVQFLPILIGKILWNL